MQPSSMYEIGLRFGRIGEPFGLEPRARQGGKGGAGLKQDADQPRLLFKFPRTDGMLFVLLLWLIFPWRALFTLVVKFPDI